MTGPALLAIDHLSKVYQPQGGGQVEALRDVSLVFEPLITYAAAFPKIVLFPVLLLFFGVGPESKMAMGAISGFVPAVLNVLVEIVHVPLDTTKDESASVGVVRWEAAAGTFMAMRTIDGRYIKMARSLGISRLQMYRKIYVPGMVYPIIAGARLGAGLAVVGALLGEIKVSNGGMGWLTPYYLAQFTIPKMYAVLALIFIAAAAVNVALTHLLARFTRFKASEVAEGRPLM